MAGDVINIATRGNNKSTSTRGTRTYESLICCRFLKLATTESNLSTPPHDEMIFRPRTPVDGKIDFEMEYNHIKKIEIFFGNLNNWFKRIFRIRFVLNYL